MNGDMNEQSLPKGPRGRRWLVWLAVIVVGLPLLFYLFEFVVPKLLPANF